MGGVSRCLPGRASGRKARFGAVCASVRGVIDSVCLFLPFIPGPVFIFDGTKI